MRTPAQALGDLCHAVLEELVATGAIRQERWAESVDPSWLSVAERMADEIHAAPHEDSLSGSPQSWPGYVMKRARLRKAARRLHDLLATAGSDAEMISEAPLTTADGKLQGRPDLIVRDFAETWVVDYKTGSVMDGDGFTPRAIYVRQLQLYALLEQANTGRWPTQGFLVPLNGPVVEVRIDPNVATELGEQALGAIESFNSVVPATQPAAPGPEACRYCPSTTSCAAFWEACDASCEEPLATAAGVVRSAVRTAIGGVSLVLNVQVGSLESETIVVRNVSLTDHPLAAGIQAGDEIALVKLHRIPRSEEFALPAWGSLAIWAPAK